MNGTHTFRICSQNKPKQTANHNKRCKYLYINRKKDLMQLLPKRRSVLKTVTLSFTTTVLLHMVCHKFTKTLHDLTVMTQLGADIHDMCLQPKMLHYIRDAINSW